MKRVLAIALSAALLGSVAACSEDGPPADGSAAEVPGITATEIKVGTHMPLTGPASAGYSKISPATKAYFDYVNANGGVNGRKITYVVKDDGYNPANTQTVVRELVLQEKVFAILNGLGTPTHTSVLDFLKTNRVPDLFVASGSRSWNQPDKYPGTFGYNVDYFIEGKILAEYAKKTWPGEKVCHFGQDDDFGADSLAGVEQVLGAANVAAKQKYVTSNTNIGAQIGALKAAGCQVVITATVPGFTALSIGTAAQLPGGFKPRWVVSSVGGDYTTLAATLKTAAPLLNDMVGAYYLPLPGQASDPWIQLFKKINEQYNGNAPFDGNIVYGMSVGYTFVEALLKAGKNVTRENIQTTLTKGLSKGPGLAPLRFSEKDHSGYGGLRMTKVTGSTQDYFGPTYTTDGAGGPITEYTEAATAPPANGIPTA